MPLAPPKTIPQKTAPSAPPALPPDFAEFAPRAGYQVEPDGRVYTMSNGKKSYVPPWIVWQNSSTGKTADGQLTPEGFAYRVPGSDPSSAWHFMYEQSGPFRKGSQWDNENGTYKGSVDWGTLIGTLAAGGIIGAGIAGAVTGGSAVAGDVGATTTVPELGATAPVLEGTAVGTGATTTAAGLGTAPIAAETGATTGIASGAGLPGAVAAPAVGDLATGGSAIAGTNLATDTVAANTPGMLSKTLSTLTTPSVLSTIASGAFSAYGANQAAGAQTDAAKIVADANTAAAKIQSDAAIQAANIQAKSTAAALDFAKSGYNNQIGAYNTNQQQLAPYTGAGDAAVTKLSQLLGLGTPSASFTPLQPVPTTSTAPQQTGVQSMQRPGTAAQQAAADAFVPNAVQNSPALSAVPQTPGPNAGSIASLAPQQTQMVTMRAPDGSTRQVPPDHVQELIAKGAKIDDGSAQQNNLASATQAAASKAQQGPASGLFF